MQTLSGVSNVAVHYYNYMFLSIISLYQDIIGFLEKYATFSQVAGTLLNCNEKDNYSITSVIFKAPINPNRNDSKEDLISNNKRFILSHS